MGVEITVALSDREIDMIREARETVTMNIQDYEKKRNTEGKIPDEECTKYGDLVFKEVLLNKIIGLIENETEKNIIRNARILKEPVRELNIRAKVSTVGDIERYGKLCSELLQKLEETSQEQEDADNGYIALSGKELRELVNKWIVHHAKHDINLSPGYFERLLRGWEVIYRRQCGMSMLDIF